MRAATRRGPPTATIRTNPALGRSDPRRILDVCRELLPWLSPECARMKTAVDTGLQNTGFRCVKDGTPP